MDELVQTGSTMHNVIISKYFLSISLSGEEDAGVR